MTQQPPKQEPQSLAGLHGLFQDPRFENWTSEWKISQRIRNNLKENRAAAEGILDHQFLQIHRLDVKSPPCQEALVRLGYEPANQCSALSGLAVFGGRFSEKEFGTREGNSLRFTFPHLDGWLHNPFTWNEWEQTWRSYIEQQDQQGQWSVFAEDAFQRAGRRL